MMSTNQTQENTGLTLSQATEYGRKGIVTGVLVIASYLVIRMLFIASVNYYKAMNPPPPLPPTVGFGRLPAISFPEQEDDVWPNKFVLEAAEGKLTQFGDRAKVYQMVESVPNLMADEKVREIARKYGFLDSPEMLNVNLYRWSKLQPLEKTFEINLIDYDFSIRSDYQSRLELVVGDSLPEKHEAVQTVKSFLKRNDFLPDDIATASGKVSYIRVLGGEVLKAVSLSDANFVKVDLNKVPLDDQFEMYTPEGGEGVITAIISGGLDSMERIVEMDYRNQEIMYESVHTYPLKLVNTAWKEFNQKKGYIASGKKLERAVIRRVVLGYFDSFEDQSYLQPIYVFLGDDNFIGYVSAVDSQYIVN